MEKTILVTGGTGYIGSWIVKDLLEKGYIVRLTVRNKNKRSKYQHLLEIEKKTGSKLEIWEADLLNPGSYDEVAKGCDAVIHTASPFILNVKNPQKQLIDPALKGTENVLNAAVKSGTVKKIVLTSSVAAIFGDNIDMKEQGLSEFTEEQFNKSSSVTHQPYSYSKVLAEKAAWKIHGEQKMWKLVVINPSFVMGPSLIASSDSESLKLMKDLLTGRYRMGVPELMFGFVDVRDVAKAHVLALENKKAEGRYILSERTLGIYGFAELIREKYGNQFRLPVMKAPKFMLYLTGWMFGFSLKYVHRNIGHRIQLNTGKSRNQLGLSYIPLETTIDDMITQMRASKIIG